MACARSQATDLKLTCLHLNEQLTCLSLRRSAVIAPNVLPLVAACAQGLHCTCRSQLPMAPPYPYALRTPLSN